MADALITHAFVSLKADPADATKIGASKWNAALLLSGGADGEILTRSAASATGAAWTAGGGGATGPEGPAGPAGAAGAQGIPGPAGETGLSYFRLAADGSAFGPTIGDYFGANSALATELNGIYELFFWLHFFKGTSGNTVTFSIVHTAAMTNVSADGQFVAAGIQSAGTVGGAGVVGGTGTSVALPVLGAFGFGVNCYVSIRALVECGAAGNLRLRATNTSGTVTPQRGSYYTARKLTAANVGTFVA